MQHIASSSLSWSAERQVYELTDARRGVTIRMTVEDSAWFAWLEEATSFAFHGQSGSFTARKETKQRGDVYWYAYRRMENSPKSIWARPPT
jgi:LuxR family maltose regulon positive regulatory protein